MGACPFGENFRSFCEQRPPLVSFIFCLLSLGVAFGGFGAYIHFHEVKNPDIAKDWNTFLHALSLHLFCTPSNVTEDLSQSLWPSASPELNQTMAEVPTRGWVTISLLTGLVFHPPGADVDNESIPSRAHLWARISGQQLGFTGPDSQKWMHFTVTPSYPHSCGGERPCLLSEFTASCLTITAPASLLPTTRRPLECVVQRSLTPSSSPRRLPNSQSESTGKAASCYEARYNWDPSLTTMLLEGERLLCQSHLFYASCALLLIASGLCCLGTMCTPSSRERRLREHL